MRSQALAHTHAHVHKCTPTCIRIHVYCKYGSMHVNVYVSICVYACIHVCIHTCTHLSCSHQKKETAAHVYFENVRMHVCARVRVHACTYFKKYTSVRIYHEHVTRKNKQRSTHTFAYVNNKVNACVHMCVCVRSLVSTITYSSYAHICAYA